MKTTLIKALSCTLLLAGCGEAKFGSIGGAQGSKNLTSGKGEPSSLEAGKATPSGANDFGDSADSSEIGVDKNGLAVEQFAAFNLRDNVDIVWVIDPSWHTIENIKVQFHNFIAKIQDDEKLRVILMSSNRPDWGMMLGAGPFRPMATNLPAGPLGARHHHIAVHISWAFARAITAVASCDPSTNVFTYPTAVFCNQDVSLERFWGSHGQDIASGIAAAYFGNSQPRAVGLSTIAGKLKEAYRPDAARVLVVAQHYGDDEDDMVENDLISNDQYVKLLRGQGQQVPRFYTFMEKNGYTKTVSELAQRTGGDVFEMMNTNWDSDFDKILKDIHKFPNTELKLAHNINSIESVEIDGVMLSPEKYEVMNQTLFIDAGAVTKNSSQIRVTYKVAMQE